MTAGRSAVSAVRMTGGGAVEADVRRAFDVLARRAACDDMVAAHICHDAAVVIEGLGDLRTAEILHRRAGLLLVALPTGTDVDRQRIRWARSLAANLSQQGRADEAADILRAASALSEGLLGPRHEETIETARLLDDIRGDRSR